MSPTTSSCSGDDVDADLRVEVGMRRLELPRQGRAGRLGALDVDAAGQPRHRRSTIAPRDGLAVFSRSGRQTRPRLDDRAEPVRQDADDLVRLACELTISTDRRGSRRTAAATARDR